MSNVPHQRIPSYRKWGISADGTIEFISLTEKTLEGALNVIRRSFFVRENVSIGVGLLSEPGASDELEELCMEAAKDGVSIVAVNLATKDVVGVAFNKIQVKKPPSEKSDFELFSKERCKCKASQALLDFMISIDSRMNLFERYDVDCILEVMFLATSPDYGQRGIGELLVASSVEIARQLKSGKPVKTPVVIDGDGSPKNSRAVPHLVSAIMTSNYSQKIATKCGFVSLVRVAYDTYRLVDGTLGSRISKEHPDCVLVAKHLP